ncbi:hypothetical protein D8M04_05910 [Oceanobacillus piezotolerans]|uniref:Uncharacterized protein n=1 Tax=Oceanobacillus piezotolerans TaxID=2448030 RepID=A0A498DAX7_9BACI|nr:hypothetical protein [Oceanobacillus piezotolerans]RLL46738.1 hypothetical protein D8M04_05910 [Oceanobacillus piezotolerans]
MMYQRDDYYKEEWECHKPHHCDCHKKRHHDEDKKHHCDCDKKRHHDEDKKHHCDCDKKHHHHHHHHDHKDDKPKCKGKFCEEFWEHVTPGTEVEVTIKGGAEFDDLKFISFDPRTCLVAFVEENDDDCKPCFINCEDIATVCFDD